MEAKVWNLQMPSKEATRYQADGNKKRTGEVWKSMRNIKAFISKGNFSVLFKYHNWDFWNVIKYRRVGHYVFLL
jgi:hypothetical protein